VADFTLKKKKVFTFCLEGSKKVYSLPPVTKLPIDQVVLFQKFQDMETVETFKAAREFVLGNCPDLADADISDYEYMEIFGAYAKFQSNMGES